MLHSTLIKNILKHFTMQEKGYGKSKMYHLYLIQFKEHNYYYNKTVACYALF